MATIKNKVLKQYETAKKFPHMLVLWYVENGQLFCNRLTSKFPKDDFMNAVDLLRAQLEVEEC